MINANEIERVSQYFLQQILLPILLIKKQLLCWGGLLLDFGPGKQHQAHQLPYRTHNTDPSLLELTHWPMGDLDVILKM